MRVNESRQKSIMILGASVLQLPAIAQAKKMGLRVIAVDMNPDAVGFQVEGIEKAIISTIDTERVLKAAEEFKIDGIMTLASDMPMRTVAVVARKLGLVGVTEETAFKATNKVAMRNALNDAGVPIPFYKCVSNQSDFTDAVKEVAALGVRCIVKPADNSGSRGIILLKDYSDASLSQAYMYSKEYSRNGDVLVEEYMEGPEVSVETIAVDGTVHVIQITDKITTGAPYFVEMGHTQPANHSQEILDRIREVAIAANHALGIENGPSHTEIKLTKNGPKIVELGARLGGDNITTHLVPLSTGVNMVEACIRIAVGEKPDLDAKFYKASAVRYIQAEEGVIQKIEGCEAAEKTSCVKQVSIVHGVGAKSVPIRNSVDRIGFVIAQADSISEAIKSCETAISHIQIEVKNDL